MVHRILVIDGDPAQRDLLTCSLQNRLGYKITVAASAHEAEQYFYGDPAAKPDLVLFDWPPAGKECPDTLFKALTLHAPMVVLVKYGDYEAALNRLDAGAQDFLTKPVAIQRVSTTFRNLLLLQEARREVERLRREQAGGEKYAQHATGNGSYSSLPATGMDGNIRRMEDIEADAIRFAMQHYHGRMTEVARRLGIGRSTLYRKLSGLSIRHEEAA
jgi:DNA-binding NtrC family response regulator